MKTVFPTIIMKFSDCYLVIPKTQFFIEDLNTYQTLPRPYMRSFDGEPADQVFKKMGVRLGKYIRNICIGKYRVKDNE